MKNNTNLQNTGIGLIAVIIVGLIIQALFHEIGQAPWQFITILIALVGTLITFAGKSLFLKKYKVDRYEQNS
jgi:predicted RND superfamily exporter protein